VKSVAVDEQQFDDRGKEMRVARPKFIGAVKGFSNPPIRLLTQEVKVL
jgi:hypothetical protein